MLVLTRKHQEKIRIGEHITITVLRTKGKAVRLGIEAPAEVPVIRGELIFEAGHEVQPQSGSVDAVACAPGTADSGHLRSQLGRTAAAWPAKTEPTLPSTRRPEMEPPRVSLQRVPRRQISAALPRLASGSSPLREMLDRRPLST